MTAKELIKYREEVCPSCSHYSDEPKCLEWEYLPGEMIPGPNNTTVPYEGMMHKGHCRSFK